MADEASAVINGLRLGFDVWQNHQDNKSKKAARKEIDNWHDWAQKYLEDQYGQNTRLSSAGDVARYQSMRDSFDPSQFVISDADLRSFNKNNYNVEQFLNPNREAIMDDVAKTAQHTAAGSALGHSSGALTSINRSLMDKDEQLYRDAREQMNQERNFDYGMYTNFINQQQQRLNALRQGYVDSMNNLKGDIQFDQQQKDNYTNNVLSLGNSTVQSKAALV